MNMAGTVEDVRDENYKEFTDAPASIVAYGLATCEPCKIYDPILEETAAKFPDVKVGKAKMHVPGRCREIKKSHTFETYPTTHFFSKGKLLLTREGVVAGVALIGQLLPTLHRLREHAMSRQEEDLS